MPIGILAERDHSLQDITTLGVVAFPLRGFLKYFVRIATS